MVSGDLAFFKDMLGLMVQRMFCPTKGWEVWGSTDMSFVFLPEGLSLSFDARVPSIRLGQGLVLGVGFFLGV